MNNQFNKYIPPLFIALFALIPVVFSFAFSEIFELPKILLVYTGTVGVVCLFLLQSAKKGSVTIRRTKMDSALVLFLAAMTISTLISFDSRASWLGYYSRYQGGLLSLVSLSLLFWIGVSVLDTTWVKKILLGALISSLVAALIGIGEHFGISVSCFANRGDFSTDCWVQSVQIRPFSTFGQPNWFAAWLAAMIPIAVAFSTRKQTKVVSIFLAIIFTIALLFTKSRSGTLAAVAALIVYGAFAIQMKRLVLRSIALCFAGIIAVFFIVGTPWTPSFITKPQTQEVTTGTVIETGGTDSGVIRKIVWTGAINIWKHYPLFGSGVETFADAYFAFRPTEHNQTSEWNYLYNKAHNEYLHILATTGTVGFVSYGLLIVTALWVLAPSKKSVDYPLSVGLFAGFVSLLITNFFGFSVVPTAFLFFLFPALGVSLHESKKTQSIRFHAPHIASSVGVIFCAGIALVTIVRYGAADYAYNRSVVAVSQNNMYDANKDILTAISLSPREALYWDQKATIKKELAFAALGENKLEEAYALAQEAQSASDTAYKIAPRRVKLVKSRANLFADLSQIAPDFEYAAIDTIDALTTLSPTDPAVYYSQAIAYARLGNSQKSFESFEKAILLKPDYKRARYAYAVLLAEVHEDQKAVEQLEYILMYIDPTDTQVQEKLTTLSR